MRNAADTLYDLIRARAGSNPAASCIDAPNRSPLQYSELVEHVDRIVDELANRGIGRNDRVAIVMPNGPEMATAFLAVSAAAVSAPLNPAYRESEFEFYLSDLRAKALLIPEDFESPARSAATKLGATIIEVRFDADSPAGVFRIEKSPSGIKPQGIAPNPDDIALMLHTSGTTSRPKMVPLTHGNLCRSARNIAQTLGLTEADQCLNIMPLFHIHGLVGALLSSLWAGGRFTATPGFDANRFFERLEEMKPTWYTAVPTMHQSILAAANRLGDEIGDRPLRLIRSSSASLPPSVMEEMERVFGCPVIESYGMTEASHQMASNPLPPAERKPGSVGVAAGPEISIMDAEGRELSPNEIGEIVIRGDTVTRGYFENLEANRTAFADGWFRTGDQGRLDESGYLFLTGRIKEIINRGGEKISPREIDEVLMLHPDVSQAVAFAVPDPRLGEEIGAAIVLRNEVSLSEFALLDFAADQLADFKLPRKIVFVDEIPKGPTGKLQRIGLAERLGVSSSEPEAANTSESYVPPRNETERVLAGLFLESLEIERVGVDDDFFGLGGDSISAVRLIAAVRENFSVETPIYVLFERSTVASLATYIESAKPAEGLARMSRIPRSSGDRTIELSFSQRAIWVHELLVGGTPVNHRPGGVELQGPLDVESLRSAIDEIVRRHEVLRLNVSEEQGRPIARLSPPRPVEVPTSDLSGLDDGEQRKSLRGIATDHAQGLFDMESGPLYRLRLVKLREDRYVLLLAFHHIVFDGWSMSVFVDELASLYSAFRDGRSSPLPDLEIQFRDFAAWESKLTDSGAFDEKIDYWSRLLEGDVPRLILPTEPLPTSEPSWSGATESVTFPTELLDRLESLSRDRNATLYMTLLAAFIAMMSRLSGRNDVVIGTVVSGRLRDETRPLIGMFVNDLVVRADLGDDPIFLDFLARVRAICLDAYERQEAPFELVVQSARPKRELGRNPFFDVVFQLRNMPNSVADAGELRIRETEMDFGIAPFDLSVEAEKTSGGLVTRFRYRNNRFCTKTIKGWMVFWRRLLESIAADSKRMLSELASEPPGDTGPMTESAERDLAERIRRTPQPIGPFVEFKKEEIERSIPARFEQQAAKFPERIAVRGPDREFTYRELNQTANRIANAILERSDEIQRPVALLLENDAPMIAAIVAALKANKIYVPMDPNLPPARAGYILDDSDAGVIVTNNRNLSFAEGLGGPELPVVNIDEVDPHAASSDPELEIPPDSLAWILYTSGSTGKPKGVLQSHQNVLHYVMNYTNGLRISAEDRMTILFSCSVNAGAHDIFTALLNGASAHMFSVRQSGVAALPPWLVSEEITAYTSVPTVFRHLCEELKESDRFPKLRYIKLVGEPVYKRDVELYKKHFSPDCIFVNRLGSTETGSICWNFIDHDTEIDGNNAPVGHQTEGNEVLFLDESGGESPSGEIGEIAVRSKYLSPGYWRKPELTAAAFQEAGEGSRVYRTGDMGRMLPDGSVVHHGRKDFQVKIRGHRIEVGEVVHALQDIDEIREAIALARDDRSGDRQLTAYVVLEQDCRLTVTEILRSLSKTLPEYMIPSAFVFLDEFPLAPNGKISLSSLPKPGRERPELEANYAPPRSPVENELTRIWEEVLDLDRVGRNDGFLELGGNSLRAGQVVSRIVDAFKLEIPLKALFAAPTIAEMGEVVTQAMANDLTSDELDQMLEDLDAV
jgi:amino acid adenylation domain-containing protein